MRRRLALLAAVSLPLLAAASGAQAAPVKYWSFDPATPETQRLTGGLTFAVRPGFLKTRIERLFALNSKGTAELQPVEKDLGALVAPEDERAGLYRVEAKGEGAAFVHALCPGADGAWLAFSRVKPFVDLKVEVLGQAPGAAPARCATLNFTYRGEWDVPPPLKGYSPQKPAIRGRY